MSALAYCRSYQLPAGYTLKICLDGGQLECEWAPKLPTGTRARKLLPHYRNARNDFLASLGLNIAVFEL